MIRAILGWLSRSARGGKVIKEGQESALGCRTNSDDDAADNGFFLNTFGQISRG